MKKLMLFAVSLVCAAVSAYAQQPSTGAADAGVPVEEYAPKVIIEGKWGTGPGEFGRQGDFDYDFKPESLAVDSKGNIYILDFVNNRIQKYSSEGKHIKDIPVDGLRGPIQCWAEKAYDENEKQYVWSVGASPVKPEGVPDNNLQAYIWPPEVQGVNIVINDKDDLYYYLKHNKDGKESGEVWQFKEDRLVRKISVPSVLGVLDVRDGEIWISQYPFAYVRTDIGEDYSLAEKKKIPRKQVNVAQKQKKDRLLTLRREGHGIVVSRKENKAKVTLLPIDGEEFEGEGGIKGDTIQVLSRKGDRKILNKFGLSGKLFRRISMGTQPVSGIRDSRDNVYQLVENENGLQVRRLGLGPLRE